ncbi:MAG: ECF transporter S component [Defluviitaleaceae bacterium]|nr:ECF transporter S component [Defluviitaleaceae bacterium]
MTTNWSKTQRIALTGMFGAIIFLLTFTPLGFLPTPFGISVTIVHIPVIIGAIILGPKYGAILGFMFGMASFIFASTLSVMLSAFIFTPLRPVPGTDSGSPWALLVAFGPRILVGIVAPLVYYGMKKILPAKLDTMSLAVAGIIGSATNTLLVLHLMYFMFREPWSYGRAAAGVEGAQITYTFIAGMIFTGGIPEAIAAAIIVPAVCVALFAVSKRLTSTRTARG